MEASTRIGTSFFSSAAHSTLRGRACRAGPNAGRGRRRSGRGRGRYPALRDLFGAPDLGLVAPDFDTAGHEFGRAEFQALHLVEECRFEAGHWRRGRYRDRAWRASTKAIRHQTHSFILVIACWGVSRATHRSARADTWVAGMNPAMTRCLRSEFRQESQASSACASSGVSGAARVHLVLSVTKRPVAGLQDRGHDIHRMERAVRSEQRGSRRFMMASARSARPSAR